MTKKLKVIDPFLRLDFGDTFELTEDGKNYKSSVIEDFSNTMDDGKEYVTKYHADFMISKDYAEQMVKDGYLQECEPVQTEQFRNVFDEIDDLIQKYNSELTELNEHGNDMHPAVRLEKMTVLENMTKLLKHLKGLKK